MTSAIAIIMAGGKPHPEFGPDAPVNKARLPVRDRTLVDFVVSAVEQADFRRIYVFHDGSIVPADLPSASERTVLIVRPPAARTFAEGIHFALLTIARAEGNGDLASQTIVFLPCDHPRLTADGVGELRQRFESRDADVGFVTVPTAELQKTIPTSTHRGVSFVDVGERLSVHGMAFLRGSCVRVSPGESTVTCGSWSPGESRELVDTIERARQGRSNPFQIPMLVYDLIGRRVIRRRKTMLFIRKLTRLLAGRLRLGDATDVLEALFGLSVVAVPSQWPEFSIDIDHPSDYERVFGFRWLPKTNGSKYDGASPPEVISQNTGTY